MRLSLGFSPCPNDTFIFDALIHHKIDTEGLDFDVYYDDVETLNHKAFNAALDITKLSYHAYAYAADQYVLLDSGSALGFGVGPLLVTKDFRLVELLAAVIDGEQISDKLLTVGIPGKYTTANFLLGLAFPGLVNKREMVFSAIEQAVVDGAVDFGLIIHENRFTYQQKGLHKVVDLGDYWERTTGSPIPLGGIVANRRLPEDIKHKINRVIRKSVEFAFANPQSGIEFIRSHAQEMSEDVMYKHIELYVNRFSITLGDEGRDAIHTFFHKARELQLVPQTSADLFLKSIN